MANAGGLPSTHRENNCEDDDDDYDFQTVVFSKKKKNNNKAPLLQLGNKAAAPLVQRRNNRVCVGNLPLQWTVEELRALVVERMNVNDHGGGGVVVEIEAVDKEVKTNEEEPVPRRQHAFVVVTAATGKMVSPERVVAQLRGATLRGCRLTVQREERRRKQQQQQQHRGSNGSKNRKQYQTHSSSSSKPHSSFASSSWSKPKKPQKQQSDQQGRQTGQSTTKNAEKDLADNGDEGSTRDEYPNETGSLQSSNHGPSSFEALVRQNPLSSLLEDFGAQDTEWQKVRVVDNEQLPPAQQQQTEPNIRPPVVGTAAAPPMNRLERHGKAPLHVEFLSFGYRHGIPAELRANCTGNSYSHPLPAVDCRGVLAPVPHYLAWMDGTVGAVRRAVLRGTCGSSSISDDNTDQHGSCTTTGRVDVRDFVREAVVQPAVEALVAAIDEGGYGYAMPLRVTVFVGSEQGRHRSVVTAELAATGLRKVLRQNEGNRIGAAVSVSTCHRDIGIEQQHNQRGKKENATPKLGKKQREFEDN